MTSYPFYVPKYQRGYAWEEDEVNDFINDVRQLTNPPASSATHFMGGVVHVYNSAMNIVSRRHEIVDGQQRMATVTLAMAAILKGLEELRNKSPKSDLAGICSAKIEEIEEAFLVYKETEGPKRVNVPKLTLSKSDEMFFRSLVGRNQPTPTRASHRLLKAANDAIYNELILPILTQKGSGRSKFESVVSIYKAISERCTVIHVVSQNRADAYRLFAVLNDRGRSLTEGDLLRARTLELLENEEKIQAEVQSLWDIILDGPSEDVTKFFKAYFPSVTGARAPKKDLFDTYQEEFLDNKGSNPSPAVVRQFVSNLANEKPAFDAIREGLWPFSENSIATAWDRDRLHRLVNVLRHEASHPLLLSAVKIGEKKFIEAVRLLERFVFRYITIVGAHPNPLYKPYYDNAKLMRDKGGAYQIGRLSDDLSQLIKDRADDVAFRGNLTAKLVYSDNTQRNRDIRHFLSTLESHRRWYERGAKKVPVPDTMTIFDITATTLEHVYPQTADTSEFDIDMEPIKNSLGNLAIMAQADNGAARNSAFTTKKIEFAKSSVNLTKRLAEFKSWTPKELAKREKELIDMALSVFKI
ncbi:MAG: DUF262 domain-containing HNH endonuclease family protein [Planctomycetota bacterium]|nr:DUF262 domain-containing HNH endonuclease family protein [Planctomycetota bacterium]